MSKKTILALVMSGISLMSAAEARQISVDRISHLSTVLGANFESNPKKVGDVNALPADVLDIDVSRVQIDLAWALHSTPEADTDKLVEVKKSIQNYADSVMEEAANALASQEEKDQAAQKLADEQEKATKKEKLGTENKGNTKTASSTKKGSGKKSKKTGGDAGSSDDETYAVTTPLKWRGKLCKEFVECTPDEADELRNEGLIA